MEYLNVWLTNEELESITAGKQVHVEHSAECTDCANDVEVVIQIQVK